MNTNFLEPGDPRRLSLHAPFGAGDAFCPECDMPWPCDVELQRQVLADGHAKLMVAMENSDGREAPADVAREDDPLAPGGGDDDAKLGVHGGSLTRVPESSAGEVAQ